MHFAEPAAEVYVPGAAEVGAALSRTTDLGIGAHPDDLEFSMLVPIAQCRGRDDRWFTGVVCTDGSGSARAGAYADFSDAEMGRARRAEQCSAADVGYYSAVVQLAHPSRDVRDPVAAAVLVEELAALIDATRPSNVYTHNLADKHMTHVAVGAAVIKAFRALTVDVRGVRLVGVEGWRDLDWLADHEKVLLDASGYDDLAVALAACFPSQIAAGKRYDLAAEGRRRANATLGEPRAVDEADQICVAIDLSPLIHNHELDPVAYVAAAVDRFKSEVEATLRALF
jgi:LmbE family N-acetylglucosaminyl deacetylase